VPCDPHSNPKSLATRMSKPDRRRKRMPNAANHFGHRESEGIVVDLFWDRGSVGDEFRVEVEDRREGARFVLHPGTGREAIQAFYHPFSATRTALGSNAWAA
jgi:hypothetical protein